MSYRFLIKFPTRERPKQFFHALDKYYSLASGKNELHFMITCDANDSTMNNTEVKNRLDKYDNLTCIFGASKSKVDAINRDLDQCGDFDVLLLASDDMVPVEQGYDEVIAVSFRQHFPDLDGVTWFNDGFQKQRINTLCILGKKYFDRFGYIYHPSYTSLYCDNEFTEVANRLNKQVYIDRVIIKHEHYLWNRKVQRDALYQRNDNFYAVDKRVFMQRKAQNFTK